MDVEDKNSTKDVDLNWVELIIYHNEVQRNPESKLNLELCQAITKAYKLTSELKRYERDQESYEREKGHFVQSLADIPITKVDHSNIPEEEQRKRMLELMKEEWEALEKKDKS